MKYIFKPILSPSARAVWRTIRHCRVFQTNSGWESGLPELTPFERAQWSEKQKTNYGEIDFTDVEFYDADILAAIEKHLLGNVEGTSYHKSEMSHKDRAFLNGIIRKTKPKTIVEIGLSAGGSSCVILNAIHDLADAKLYSFDYSTVWYRENARAGGKKSGFLVNEIIPDLMSKWVIYTGGVPCKYFDRLPNDGVDICVIDSAHANPGEHLNVLEILPFMKTGGIIIFHDTAYHTTIDTAGVTNCISLNTLNGKRIRLKTEQTMGLPNIGAVILNDNIDDMLFPLFSNISLPWHYKIADEDFAEMLKHFLKYYPRDLVRIYVYYCYFYMNGGLLNPKKARAAAEEKTAALQKRYFPYT